MATGEQLTTWPVVAPHTDRDKWVVYTDTIAKGRRRLTYDHIIKLSAETRSETKSVAKARAFKYRGSNTEPPARSSGR